MKNIHPNTGNLDIVINGVYSYVNKHNYVTIIRVTRFSEKSIFAYRLLYGGEWSKSEFRMGVKDFKTFTLQKNPIN